MWARDNRIERTRAAVGGGNKAFQFWDRLNLKLASCSVQMIAEKRAGGGGGGLTKGMEQKTVTDVKPPSQRFQICFIATHQEWDAFSGVGTREKKHPIVVALSERATTLFFHSPGAYNNTLLGRL